VALSSGSKWFLAFALLGVAGVAAGLWWLDENVFVDDVEAGVAVDYDVARGQSVRDVGDDLAELGVVRSSVQFRLEAADQGLDRSMQPGRYEFETGMSIDDAVAVLAAGPLAPPTIRFTVPEGLTVTQTLERLEDQFPAFTAADFRAVLDARTAAGENGGGNLVLPDWVPEPAEVEGDIEPYEGLLFPETYDVNDDASPREVLQRMIDQLVTTMGSIPDEEVAATADRGIDRYEALILASLIERETRVNDERRTVAGVIENRLVDGMRLQIDATVVYALGAEPTAIVTLDDLEIDHPHNTYVIDGLPPTPIAGAGRASIEAAFDPADVSFLFYVLSDACDGTHVFADTLEEHNVNVEAYRAVDRCA
jgi:UPF0755 protein